jgi:hypothetical protein
MPAPGHGVFINGPGPQDWIDRYQTVTLVTLAALPLAVLAVWGLARRRHARGKTTRAWRTSLAEVAIIYTTLPWVWLTMLPASPVGPAHGTVSLVPLRDLSSMPTYQILGNLLIFVVPGFLAPLRFRVLASIPRMLALVAGCSVLIETFQYVRQVGRVSSVDDVLLSTLGAGLAVLVSRRWWHHQDRQTNASPGPFQRGRRPTVIPASVHAEVDVDGVRAGHGQPEG